MRLGMCVGKCWVGNGKRGWTNWFVLPIWFAVSLALSSANASQNALWVMKLSFLHAVFYTNLYIY